MFIIESLTEATRRTSCGMALIISACTIIGAITPSQVDNNFLNMISKIINTLSFNIGKAKNHEDAV